MVNPQKPSKGVWAMAVDQLLQKEAQKRHDASQSTVGLQVPPYMHSACMYAVQVGETSLSAGYGILGAHTHQMGRPKHKGGGDAKLRYATSAPYPGNEMLWHGKRRVRRCTRGWVYVLVFVCVCVCT